MVIASLSPTAAPMTVKKSVCSSRSRGAWAPEGNDISWPLISNDVSRVRVIAAYVLIIWPAKTHCISPYPSLSVTKMTSFWDLRWCTRPKTRTRVPEIPFEPRVIFLESVSSSRIRVGAGKLGSSFSTTFLASSSVACLFIASVFSRTASSAAFACFFLCCSKRLVAFFIADLVGGFHSNRAAGSPFSSTGPVSDFLVWYEAPCFLIIACRSVLYGAVSVPTAASSSRPTSSSI